jgi:hypothetical protein
LYFQAWTFREAGWPFCRYLVIMHKSELLVIMNKTSQWQQKNLLPAVLHSHSPTPELTKHEELYRTREDQPFIYAKCNYTFKILQLKFKQVLKWCVIDRTDHYANRHRQVYILSCSWHRSESKVFGVSEETQLDYILVSLRSGSGYECGLRGRKHNLKYCAWIAESDPNGRFLLPNVKEKTRYVRRNVRSLRLSWCYMEHMTGCQKVFKDSYSEIRICLRMSWQFGVKLRTLLWSHRKLKRFFVAVNREDKIQTITINRRYDDNHVYWGELNFVYAYHNQLKHVLTSLCKVTFRPTNTTDRQN